jgi:SWIM zinc finger
VVAATSLSLSGYAPRAMPSRRPSSLAGRLPDDAALEALAAIEIPDCGCVLEMLPVCTAGGKPGCERRQRGKQCSCPRWPGAPCEHVLALAERLNISTPQEAEAFAAVWCNLLWQMHHDAYRDRPAPYRPVEAIAAEDRVRLMEMRESMKLSLWHPRDVRRSSSGGSAPLAGLGRLLDEVQKSAPRKEARRGRN